MKKLILLSILLIVGCDNLIKFDLVVSTCGYYKNQARVIINYNGKEITKLQSPPSNINDYFIFKNIPYSSNETSLTIDVAFQNGFGAWGGADRKWLNIDKNQFKEIKLMKAGLHFNQFRDLKPNNYGWIVISENGILVETKECADMIGQ